MPRTRAAAPRSSQVSSDTERALIAAGVDARTARATADRGRRHADLINPTGDRPAGDRAPSRGAKAVTRKTRTYTGA